MTFKAKPGETLVYGLGTDVFTGERPRTTSTILHAPVASPPQKVPAPMTLTKDEARRALVASMTDEERAVCDRMGVTYSDWVDQRMAELLRTDPHGAR